MQYFTEELWNDINGHNPDKRMEAEERWARNHKDYLQYLIRIQDFLPEQLLYAMIRNDGLREFCFDEISVVERSVRLTVSSAARRKRYYITIDNMISFSVNIKNSSTFLGDKMSCGFSEFKITTLGHIQLNILCDLCNELEIVFPDKYSCKISAYNI